MTNDLARADINRLMSAAIEELEAKAAVGEMNSFLAKSLGAVAGLLGFNDVLGRVEILISGLSPTDFLKDSLSNIDWDNVSSERLAQLCRIQPQDQFNADHPICRREFLVPELERVPRDCLHRELCLQGDVTGAIRAAKSDLDYEEIADLLAALGLFDEAIKLIDSQPVPLERQHNVRFVVLVEKCRRLVPSFSDEIARYNPTGYDRLHIVLALAQCRPWVGYPYPDY